MIKSLQLLLMAISLVVNLSAQDNCGSYRIIRFNDKPITDEIMSITVIAPLRNIIVPVHGDTAFICTIPKGEFSTVITIDNEQFNFGGMIPIDILYGDNTTMWNIVRSETPDLRIECPDSLLFHHVDYWKLLFPDRDGSELIRQSYTPKY